MPYHDAFKRRRRACQEVFSGHSFPASASPRKDNSSRMRRIKARLPSVLVVALFIRIWHRNDLLTAHLSCWAKHFLMCYKTHMPPKTRRALADFIYEFPSQTTDSERLEVVEQLQEKLVAHGLDNHFAIRNHANSSKLYLKAKGTVPKATAFSTGFLNASANRSMKPSSTTS